MANNAANPNLPGRIRKIETNLEEISGILNAAKRTTANAPSALTIKAPGKANSNDSNGNGRKGTRHYANGRNEPWWNTNEGKRPLPNGWKRAVSQKVNKGKSFYFKNDGETTWNNPLNGQVHLVNQPHPTSANGEISPSAAENNTNGANRANVGNGRKGTRHYANGRNEPWWNTNEAKRPLPNGWKRSVSKKVNSGKSFYFKNDGETTWNNPLNGQVHLVDQPNQAGDQTPDALQGGHRSRRNKRATRRVSRW